ncbi:MAG: DeoR/GlpR transcriptional regulator [Clostridia bacterium]|nr:DeoR/GlpR transcriptional regulator [Clostridia bacterium]
MKHDRQRLMKQLIHDKKTVTVQALQDQFDVSFETIRRDLRDLEAEGILTRVYGGAVLADHSVMPNNIESWDYRAGRYAERKALIANEMLRYIPDNATIALDSGTTMYLFAKLLKQRQNLTVITNDLHTADALCSETDHEVFFVGGVMQRTEKITAGYYSLDFLKYFAHIDITVLTADGFDPKLGISDHNIDMGSLKMEFIKRSEKVFAMFDSSKFITKAPYHVCPTERIDLLITDDKVSEENIREIRKQNVRMITVHV